MSFEIDGGELVARGALLPNGVYISTVEKGEVTAKAKGTQVALQLGDLVEKDSGSNEFALDDGTTFRIGNRKLFFRAWWDHENEQAVAIGHRDLFKIAIAAGLIEKPAPGQKATFPFATPEDFIEAMIGKRFGSRTKQKPQTQKLADGTKEPILDDETGEQKVNVEVVAFEAA